MISTVVSDAEQRMRKCIDSFKYEISKLRTGRAHPSILDHVCIEYYGKPTPLSQVANITVSDVRTLVVTPWDKKMLPAVEKAIASSGLGLSPVPMLDHIRVSSPVLTEERRKDLIKIVKHEAEAARINVRNVRRDANTAFKNLLKTKDITENEERKAIETIQKVTDKFIAEIEQIFVHKETELLAV